MGDYIAKTDSIPPHLAQQPLRQPCRQLISSLVRSSEKAGIYPLLDVDDMVAMRKPDWKCVFTYVQSIYRRFKDQDWPPHVARTSPRNINTLYCRTNILKPRGVID